MAGVGPLDLVAAVQAVAVVLDGQPVDVISLHGRCAYSDEASAVVTVQVHLGSAKDVDLVADLLDLAADAHEPIPELHSREADWTGGVYVHLFGPSHARAHSAAASSSKAVA